MCIGLSLYVMTTMHRVCDNFFILLAILVRCSLTLSTLVSTQNETVGDMMFMSDDVQCLAQMPIGDLMKIRRAIGVMHAVSVYDAYRMSNETALQINSQAQNHSDSSLQDQPTAESRSVFQHLPTSSSTVNTPMAQPFMMTSQVHDAWKKNQLTSRVGYGSEWEEEKPSKIQKIFHLSLTALSFLAFAGYLLCMIVQAIKSKGTTYVHSTSMPMVSVDTGTTKRITRFRPNRFRRRRRAAREQIISAEPDPLIMLEALSTLSRGYVQLGNILQPPT